MDMSGERRIPAPRQKVWDALNDPQMLKACIPGCESMERQANGDLKATAAVRIGPISTRFSGNIKLLDLDPPNSYRIAGEGQGGAAGFAKGGATVNLADDGAFTVMRYDVKAQVGGKIAQLGARLVDATSKQMADAFFDKFTTEIGSAHEMNPPQQTTATNTPEVGADGPVGLATAATAAVTRPTSPAAPVNLLSMIPAEPLGLPLVFWIGSAAFLAILVMIFGPLLWG